MTRDEKCRLYFGIAVKELRLRRYDTEILDRWEKMFDEFETDTCEFNGLHLIK